MSTSGNEPARPSSTPKPPKLTDTGRQSRGGPAGGFRPEKKVAAKPKRVRGGVKLRAAEGEPIGNWVSQRLMRVVEQAATGEALREGLEYARLGQAKKFDVEGEFVSATIQGRMTRPYTTELRLTMFDHGSREKVIAAMGEQAVYAAKLLAGELPRDIEDLFAPLGLRLLPVEAAEVQPTCTCREPTPPKPWCKHAVCAAVLLAEKLAGSPLLVLGLRGLPVEELVERLREKRVLAGAGDAPTPVYTPHVAGASDAALAPLEELSASFWDDPADTAQRPALPRIAPEIDKPLLRRLGPSPFEARFPMVGLLATCYELIAERVVRTSDADLADAADEKAEENPDSDES